jgi:hypothetical protein
MSATANVDWLTLEDAARELWPERAEHPALAGQLLQLCLDGTLTLALRLAGANGTAWESLPSEQSGGWWKARFKRGVDGSKVTALDGTFDLALEEGGRELIEAIRCKYVGLPQRPAGLLAGRIKLVSVDNVPYALLGLAREHDVDLAGAPHVRSVTIDGLFTFQAPEWPLKGALASEPVIRSCELARLLAAPTTGQPPSAAGIPSLQGGASGLDRSLLATPKRLINAFGKVTGMDESWFRALKDTPALLAARKVKGRGQRNPQPPLFCPFEVMTYLLDPKRKKGSQFHNRGTAWRFLEDHFPIVYAAHAGDDPRGDPPG